jgi:glucuronate isomerase
MIASPIPGSLAMDLLEEINQIRIIDPHSHIPPEAPAAKSIDDLLSYHYFTELAHSLGMPKACLAEGYSARERCREILSFVSRMDNTVQYSWLMRILKTTLGYSRQALDPKDCDQLYDLSEKVYQAAGWENQSLELGPIDQVFLTNDFDDPLEGFDPNRYVPCLRTDELVFHWQKPGVKERLAKRTGVDVSDRKSLARALRELFQYFLRHGARACAISLPPGFHAQMVSEGDLNQEFSHKGVSVGRSQGIFWEIATCCEEFGIPFDLMFGVNRDVFPQGVHQGRDLFDQRISLIQLAPLFNAFPTVKFPVSVLSSPQNSELVAYSWIFPNVIASGHWWYANIPSLIEQDLRSRLHGIPREKILGYYSDMYKLEFGPPKYLMFKQILARVLAEDYVAPGAMSKAQAIALARDLLRNNAERIFPAK